MSELIKTPVRYDAKSRHIFEADGNSISWFPRNSHHPQFHRMDEAGEYIALCINDHERLVAENERLKADLAKAEKVLANIAEPALGGKLQQYAAQAYFANAGDDVATS